MGWPCSALGESWCDAGAAAWPRDIAEEIAKAAAHAKAENEYLCMSMIQKTGIPKTGDPKNRDPKNRGSQKQDSKSGGIPTTGGMLNQLSRVWLLEWRQLGLTAYVLLG